MLPSIQEKIKCRICRSVCCRFEFEKLGGVITLRDRCLKCQGVYRKPSRKKSPEVEASIEFYKFQLFNIYKAALTNKKIRDENGIDILAARKYVASYREDEECLA